jgi:GntR family transcriptional regulator/MocR family aminotransferase
MTDAMWKQLMQLSARNSMSLQARVREMLVSAILDGHIPPGETIPSSRKMAEMLGVGRITVMMAYQQLVDENYLVSSQRSGHIVNPDVLADHVKVTRRPADLPGPARAGRPALWHKRLCMHPTAQRSIVKPSDWQKYPYPFLYGQFDQTLFPTAGWRECCSKALSVTDIRQWAPDQITRDDDSLVQEIRTHVLPRRGVWASADELIITVGAQHALYMVADLLIREGTRVAIEDPGYPDARNIFSTRTSQLLPQPVDGDGLCVNERLHTFDYVYVTPSHQCPTGVTMPLGRRETLLRMADDSDFAIIEDDFESENSFEGSPIPALKSMDRSNRVIYIGSLSKSMAPGLRIGYIVAAPELIAELRALRRLMLRHPSTFIQRTLALFISLGHNDAQLRRLAQAQRERCAVLLDALVRLAPQCRVTPIQGGGSCWVQLPDGIDTAELAAHAASKGVLIEPGDVFFMADTPPGSFVRLGYQSIPVEKIEAGVTGFAAALAELQQARGPIG